MENQTRPSSPYNFVQLNTKVLRAPFMKVEITDNVKEEPKDLQKLTDEQRKYAHYIKDKSRNSGYFDITITAKTPVMIARELGKEDEITKFFALGNNKCIPGSSLRGCIKNLYKIISCSTFKSGSRPNGDTKDKRLYFRSFASAFDKLKLHYGELMTDQETKNIKTRAGYLVYTGKGKNRRYFIVPCPSLNNGISNYENMREEEMVNWTEITGEKHNGNDIYVYVGLNPSLGDKPNTPGGARWHDDYVDIFTGVAENKKSFYRMYKPVWNTTIPVPADLIESYKSDKSRGRIPLVFNGNRPDKKLVESGYVQKPNEKRRITQDCSCYDKLLEKGIVYEKVVTEEGNEHFNQIDIPEITIQRSELDAKKREIKAKYADDREGCHNNIAMLNGVYYDYVVPCFFIADENDTKILSFGANPYYRTPYNNNISKKIPAGLMTSVVDFTDAVFGDMAKWGSRVAFEDCYLVNDCGTETPAYTKQMGSPQLTSFQNYLEPDAAGEACHWDEKNPDIHVRGYKMYWHKDGSDWQGMKTNMTNHRIEPVKAGTVFKGRIRFDNLGNEELGALAEVLTLCDDLEHDICMKIGSGKPIGLGSIKLKAVLHLRDNDYYRHLFSNGALAAETSDVDVSRYIDDFHTYMADEFKENKDQLALHAERMEELKLIMDFGMKDKMDNWDDITRYIKLPMSKPKGSDPAQVKDAINEHNRLAEKDKELTNYRIPLPSIKDIVYRTDK